METKSSDVYEQFAQKALTYLNSTEAFLKEQLPDYFQQVVTYYAIQSWAYFIIFLAATASMIVFAYRAWRNKDSYDPVFNAIIVLIIAALPMGAMFFNLNKALKATFAPKVFIVDYLRGKE